MDQFKIVMIGESGVGKSSIIDVFHNSIFHEHSSPTINSSVVKETIDLDEGKITLSIWDTAGQERFQSLIPLYLRNANGVILVVDLYDKEAVLKIDDTYHKITEQLNSETKLLLCLNKYDLVDVDIDISFYEQWAKKHNMSLIVTSAKTGHNISSLFYRIGKEVYESFNGINTYETNGSHSSDLANNSDSKCC